jgi:hypothetical protein
MLRRAMSSSSLGTQPDSEHALTAGSLAFGVLTFQALAYAELRSDAEFAETIGLDTV